MKKMIVGLAGILFLMSTTLAQEKKEQEKALEHHIVVTATKTKQPQAEVASSVTVITAEELQMTRKEMVLDVLRYATGLDVIQNGGVGTLANISIRGSGAGHTLVLMDGVEMNDPMSPDRSFNFGHLTVDNIEQIEVVRGPQSMLYGSDAMGGVINIITRKGEGKPKYFLSGEGGAYNTFRGTAGVSGGTDLINYSLSLSRFDTKGFSAASDKYGNMEQDGYGNTSFSARFGLTPIKNLDVDFIGRYTNAKTDLDVRGGEGGDDPNYTADAKQFFLRAQADLRLLDGKWGQKLGFSFSNNDRNYQNNKDPQRAGC
jgi:vitamin B12 transporter